MKAPVRKITAPKMPSQGQIESFCKGLSENEHERLLLECCIALSLAIAPDDERSFYTVYGYACHFADGFTQHTLEAVRLWTSGKINTLTQSDIPNAILQSFKGAYLFKWQRRLIEYALLLYDTINDKINELYPSCCTILCRHALEGALILKEIKA